MIPRLIVRQTQIKLGYQRELSVDDNYTGGECILQNIYTKEECNTPNTWEYGKFERVKMDKVNGGITEEFGIVRCNERSGEEQTWLGSTGTPELYAFYEKLASNSPSWETEWGQGSINQNIRGELDGTKFCIPDDCFIPQSTSDNSDYLDKIHYNDYIQIKSDIMNNNTNTTNTLSKVHSDRVSDYEIDTTNNVETNPENYYTKIDTQTIPNTITELSNICKENISSSIHRPRRWLYT